MKLHFNAATVAVSLLGLSQAQTPQSRQIAIIGQYLMPGNRSQYRLSSSIGSYKGTC